MILDVVVAIVALVVVTVLGVYAVAVIDRAAGTIVARRPFSPSHVLAAPLQQAAALVLQRPTSTERPDAGGAAFAPILLAAAGAGAVVAIPLASGLAIADIPDGIALYGAALAMVLVAVFVYGWSSNSAFPLVGAYRFAAQGLSYPVPFVLTLIAAALAAQSLSVGGIVSSQESVWNVIRQPFGFPVFFLSGWGLAFWGPLALPDAADLASGIDAEVSGRSLLAWHCARALVLVSVAAMGAAAFFGGWLGPVLPGAVWMVLKTVAVLVLFVVAGRGVARVRIERFVIIAWVVLIPLSLVDVFVSGAIAL